MAGWGAGQRDAGREDFTDEAARAEAAHQPVADAREGLAAVGGIPPAPANAAAAGALVAVGVASGSGDDVFKLRSEAPAVRALANASTPSRAAAGAGIADGALAPDSALYADIVDWPSLPEPVQRARSEYCLAKTVDGKADAQIMAGS